MTEIDQWIELSHKLSSQMPAIDYFDRPEFRRVRQMPEDPLNLTEMRMVCHSGTHLDAPSHFIHDGLTVDQIPLPRLMGEAVVLRLPGLSPGQQITVADVVAAGQQIRAGDMVLLDTGWAVRHGDDEYEHHPSLSVEVASWLVSARVTLVGMDFATPDVCTRLRNDAFDWPVHHILLGHDVLIVEHLTNLAALPAGRVQFRCFPLRIENGDGAPAFVMARPGRSS